MKMDLERIGSRHRGNSHQFNAESEELDQIAKEVRMVNNDNPTICNQNKSVGKIFKLIMLFSLDMFLMGK